MKKFSRRHFMASGAALGIGIGLSLKAHGRTHHTWRMPDESAPHKRTWMAFGANADIWGNELLPEVQRNLALIANSISEYEAVSVLVRPQEMALTKRLLSSNITLVPQNINDLWIRDTGPTFVLDKNGTKAAVDFNFNGWGNKQAHDLDRLVANVVANKSGVKRLASDIVLEGGCFEVNGAGTAIITESCSLNGNRNPNMSKSDFEAHLKPLLGLEKIIWLPGIAGKDITDGHTDFYARFTHPGTAIAAYEPDIHSYEHELSKTHIRMLKNATDAKGKPLEVIPIPAPYHIRPKYLSNDFAAGYVGYYVCNGAVFMQTFGDKKADQNAKAILQEQFPKRDIIGLAVDGIAAGGGSIHCATQQEPLV